MRLTKKVPYKIKTLIPVLGLAGASILSGCKDKNEPQIVQPHDVVYEFGLDNFSAFQPYYYFMLTLDSAEVKNVILQSDEKSWQHTNTYELLQAINTNILDYTSPENIHKVKGRGALHDVYITNVDDSIKLANMGFTFKDAVRKPNYSLWKTNQAQR